MPFGSLFGALVFGILGPVLGVRVAAASGGPARLMGACLILLGLSVAGGLLIMRPWARWMGVFAGIWFAFSSASAFLGRGGTFHLLVMLASLAAASLLVVPATGRPRRNPEAAPPGPSTASRFLLGTSSLAVIGFLSATAWAVARAPMAPAHAAVLPGDERSADAAPVGGSGSAATSAPKWLDFADGIKEAKSGRKLVVADFYATWCGPCKIMEKRTFKDPRVMERLRDVVPVRVDAEETVDRGGLKGADLALRYGIDVYPTIVVVDGDGHEVARNSGVMSPDEFLAWLDAVIERAGAAVART